jgi:zinc transport system substrate-binding protein
MGNQGHIRQLVPDGASSHDYQLRPSDSMALATADIVLWVGPAHEAFLRKTMNRGQAALLTAQTLPGIQLHTQRRVDDASPLPGTTDPHLWLNADNAVVIARALATALTRRDPAHALAYQQNADVFTQQMAAFKVRYATRFKRLNTRSFMAYHDAYQYIEPALGLDYRGSLTLHDEGQPGAQHLWLMAQRVQQEKISCLLAEPGFNAALARHIFNKSPARFVAVDELFVGVPFTARGYENGLAQMADEIYRCLDNNRDSK